MSDRIIGIDLGTTNSLVAAIDTGFPVVLPDASGRRLLPSVVSFSGSAEVLIGSAARNARGARPNHTFYSVKRFMGRRYDDLNELEKNVLYKIQSSHAGDACMLLDDSYLRPEDISAHVLKALRERACHYFGEDISRAVISVPAYFNDRQRQATVRAGLIAGLQVERILHEPTAAALAFGINLKKKHCRCAVFDLGGGTFDISILDVREGNFHVLATHGNTRLGGDDLDSAFALFLCNKLKPGLWYELPQDVKSRLMDAAERAKIELSSQDVAKVEIPFLTESLHLALEITRKELEALASPLFERTRAYCLRALADAKVQPDQVEEVILVGGQTRMPWVVQLVRDIFGQDPNVSMNPDETVAIGSAIQAGMIAGNYTGMSLLDVTPLSLGIETFGGLTSVLIPRNTTIPTKAGELFTNAADRQTSMKIHVLQGERELAKDNWSLGEFILPFEPAPRGEARVGVQFEINSDGILSVLARDTRTGKELKLDMASAVDVSDEKVEQMVSESIDHALEDMQERMWVETHYKATRLVEMALGAHSLLKQELSAQETEHLMTLINCVKEAMLTKDLARLKSELAALDTGTQGLAEKLMELTANESLQRQGIITE